MMNSEAPPSARLVLIGSIEEFKNWAALAEPGDEATYHSGDLPVDRRKSGHVDELARFAADAAAKGELVLLQRQLAPGAYQYFCRRAPQPEKRPRDGLALGLGNRSPVGFRQSRS